MNSKFQQSWLFLSPQISSSQKPNDDYSTDLKDFFLQNDCPSYSGLFQKQLAQKPDLDIFALNQWQNDSVTQSFKKNLDGQQNHLTPQTILSSANSNQLESIQGYFIDAMDSADQSNQSSNSFQNNSNQASHQIVQEKSPQAKKKSKRKYNLYKNTRNQCKKHFSNVLKSVLYEKYGKNDHFTNLIRKDPILNKIFYKNGSTVLKKSGSKDEIKKLLNHPQLKQCWRNVIQDCKIDMDIMSSKYKDQKYKMMLIRICKKYMSLYCEYEQ